MNRGEAKPLKNFEGFASRSYLFNLGITTNYGNPDFNLGQKLGLVAITMPKVKTMDSFGTGFFEIKIIKKSPYNFDDFNLEINNSDRDPDFNPGQILGLTAIIQAQG